MSPHRTASTPTVRIRRAEQADVEELDALERAAFPDPWPEILLASELRLSASLLWLAREGLYGRALGYASFRMGGGEAELLRLAVDPAVQRRGVGRKLVAHGLVELAQRGIQNCFLEVRPDNAPAIALYESLTFVVAGRRKGYYRDGSDALVYARSIVPLTP